MDVLAYGTGPADGMLAVATSPSSGKGKGKSSSGTTSDFAVSPIVALLPLSGAPGDEGIRYPDPALSPCLGDGGRCKIMDGAVRRVAFGKELLPDGPTGLLAATSGRSVVVWPGAEDVEAFALADVQSLTGHRDQALDIAFDARHATGFGRDGWPGDPVGRVSPWVTATWDIAVTRVVTRTGVDCSNGSSFSVIDCKQSRR